MCDIEEFITGHQDIYHSKYSDCLGNMDLYITDSLQDMLDIDIKSEMATDLGSGTDFSDALGLSFSEMPPLLDMDSDNASAWIHSYHNSNSTSFVQNMDLYGGSSEENVVMVNPNSVMPSGFTETPTKKMVNQNASHLMLNSVNSNLVCDSPLPSPKEEKSHLTFSPNTIKVTKVKDEPGSPDDRGGLVEATQMIVIHKDLHTVKKDLSTDLIDSKKIKLPTSMSTTPTLRIRSDLRINNKNCSILTPANSKVTGGTTQYVTTQSLGAKTIISGNIHILGAQQSRTILNKNQATILIENSSLNNSRHLLKTSHNTFANILENGAHAKFMNKAFIGEFPKPAYSYSCLIAMALKNSRTGSLPVSEIYNFMCQHFPYFKTAPNGWKNSVRHNLSLNKCFEKIEKPSTNGGQRKGCLWAMNPAKVEKMDEEVQKWSRKDPGAIKKAMVFPDNLEALERGEMKYSSGGGGGGGVGSDPEMDGDELDAEDNDTELDTEIEEEMDGPDEQESSEPELDVEDTTLGVGGGVGVGGSYRLLTATAQAYHDDNSDIEVMEDNTYDEIDIEEHKPEFKLEFALTDDFEEIPAKRAKSSFVYAPVSTAPHASRRKTPLVNRIA